MKLHNFYKNWN